MARHKRTSTATLHAAAQVVAARQGNTQWPNGRIAAFNARYTYSLQPGTQQRMYGGTNKHTPITATPSAPVKCYVPASVKPSKAYAVSAPRTQAQKAQLKAALAPTQSKAGAYVVGYSALIAGQQWHYCLRTGTYSAKACGILPAVGALTAAQVRRTYGSSMAAKILQLGQ